ncbi:hypothetical protein SAMN04489716_6347 [Actinoplanes derwentensis]|uniref:Uncharacterized protein n=1 Tax=Actinoplanes derwentensis TaxID=113562 RepID=A0A1H2CPN9_9ACTN|nr:hypothetical protein SAMN04489716_6347 [Actinoplanes derwentensis]
MSRKVWLPKAAVVVTAPIGLWWLPKMSELSVCHQ